MEATTMEEMAAKEMEATTMEETETTTEMAEKATTDK